MSRRRTRWALAFSALVAIGVVVWLRSASHEAPPPEVTTTKAVRGDIEDAVLATGTIEAQKLVSVGAQVTGVVTRLYVALGDRVVKGQPIAEIDSSTQQNELRKAEAGVLSVRAQRTAKTALLKQSLLATTRLRALVAIDAGSRADLENAEALYATTEADIAALDAQLSQAELSRDTARVNVGYAHVNAPIDGVVVAVVTEQGQTVNSALSAPTIIKLAQLDTMVVKAQISEADVPRVHAGLPIWFTLLGDPDTRYEATLKRVEPGPTSLATDASGTPSAAPTNAGAAKAVYYNGLFDVANPNGKLRIAMTAQVTIVVSRRSDALLIPSTALGPRSPDGRYEVRVRTGTTLADRAVRVGLNNRVMAEVLDGLRAGDEVVTADAAADATRPAS